MVALRSVRERLGSMPSMENSWTRYLSFFASQSSLDSIPARKDSSVLTVSSSKYCLRRSSPLAPNKGGAKTVSANAREKLWDFMIRVFNRRESRSNSKKCNCINSAMRDRSKYELAHARICLHLPKHMKKFLTLSLVACLAGERSWPKRSRNRLA